MPPGPSTGPATPARCGARCWRRPTHSRTAGVSEHPAITENGEMSNKRGHHQVFLGMAAGVGKTYRMLQDGQAEAEAGRDVVIGYLEPHDRPETIALSAG